MDKQGLELIVQRDQLAQTKTRIFALPDRESLAPGQVLLTVDHFAFTSNNVTYAAFGSAMKYWNFFRRKPGGAIFRCGDLPMYRYPTSME